MAVTLPVFQLEMSWLNAEAPSNTVKSNELGKSLYPFNKKEVLMKILIEKKEEWEN